MRSSAYTDDPLASLLPPIVPSPSYEAVDVGTHSPPMPMKLAERIWSSDLLDLSELLASRLGASELTLRELVSNRDKPKEVKKITPIQQWVVCFNAYISVMARLHPGPSGLCVYHHQGELRLQGHTLAFLRCALPKDHCSYQATKLRCRYGPCTSQVQSCCSGGWKVWEWSLLHRKRTHRKEGNYNERCWVHTTQQIFAIHTPPSPPARIGTSRTAQSPLVGSGTSA